MLYISAVSCCCLKHSFVLDIWYSLSVNSPLLQSDSIKSIIHHNRQQQYDVYCVQKWSAPVHVGALPDTNGSHLLRTTIRYNPRSEYIHSRQTALYSSRSQVGYVNGQSAEQCRWRPVQCIGWGSDGRRSPSHQDSVFFKYTLRSTGLSLIASPIGY